MRNYRAGFFFRRLRRVIGLTRVSLLMSLIGTAGLILPEQSIEAFKLVPEYSVLQLATMVLSALW